MNQSRVKRVERLEQRFLEIRNQELVAYEKILVNPYLKEKQRLLGYRLLLLAYRAIPDSDGAVHLSAAEIANDYRKKPDPGDSREDENPDGSRPLASRQSVKGIISGLIDAEAISASIGECHRLHENGSLYRDTDFIVPPIAMGELANRLNQLANYHRDKTRVPYGTGKAA